MRIIDLRSDTVTHPSPQMREAMYKAEVGDDVYGEDPTVNRLEELAAATLGKESALFVSSGTMGNLLALMAHCSRGDEVILASESHIVVHEQGGIAPLGGIHPRMLPTRENGTMSLDEIQDSINPDDIHFARTRLLCLENTWHGIPLSLDYMDAACTLVRAHNVAVHLDGARVFNAALALQVPVSTVAARFDSVQFCLSKGLAAPVGSMLCGSTALVASSRRLRKMLGGGMRQAGIIAAAGIVALETMVDRLAEDHSLARMLADELCNMKGLEVFVEGVQTNMVFVKVNIPGRKDRDLLDLMSNKGLLASEEGKHGIRFVTHYGITESDIKSALVRIQESLSELGAMSASAR